MTTDQFEAIIRDYPLSFDRAQRDDQVENAAFPPMVEVYWGLVDLGRPPTQAQFADAIVALVPPWPTDAVRYRAQKAYPAFVREHHAELVLTDRYRWVFKAGRRDFDGVDLLVVRPDGTPIGLALSIATSGAQSWAPVKARRHRFSAPFRVVAINADDRYVVGQFWLHQPSALIASIEQCEAAS